MSYPIRYDRATAPKFGIVFNSIPVFSPEGKALYEERWTRFFEELKAEGAIHADSLLKPRIFHAHEAQAVADEFAAARVDAVVILNSAFPNGHVFPTIALHRQLSRTPLILSSDYEPDLGDNEWTTNAWCGVIMNNGLAKRLGRHVRLLAGGPDSGEFRDEVRMLANSVRAVARLGRDFVCKFGDAPGGFHSSTVDQAAYLRHFGTRIDTIDLLGVFNVFESGVAKGYLGERRFTADDVAATAKRVKGDRSTGVSDEELTRAARFFHAIKALVEANGYTSVAVRCWPELQSSGMRTAACTGLGWLMATGLVTAAACEADCEVVVMQTLGRLLSGKPAACLDFVNVPGRCGCTELGHCGVGIPGLMGEGEHLGCISPDKQAGGRIAPTLIGQFQYGRKTGITAAQKADGNLKILCFTGENTPRSALGKLYSAADVITGRDAALHEAILAHGFPHHLAVAMEDISREVREVCGFCGVECIEP